MVSALLYSQAKVIGLSLVNAISYMTNSKVEFDLEASHVLKSNGLQI